ncbi:MAG: phosphatase PAP2 family protein [Alphaproteobacteria bacterium]|nr:phosphatase PAP2 family protein [Alphaproteobacteria bacterium]
MINEIAIGLSYISNDYLLMLIAVLLYIFSKRPEHAHLIILLLFAMVYKALLKEILQIPASVTSPTKYGFPSGHINFATMFFGWFALTYKIKLLYWICPIALALASISTIYLGYHDIYDVILTPILPICVLAIYHIYLRKISLGNFMLIFIIISSLCYLISFFTLDKMPIDVIVGSYGILGVSSGLCIVNRHYQYTAYILIVLTICSVINECIRNSIWFVIFGTLPLVASKAVKNFRKN